MNDQVKQVEELLRQMEAEKAREKMEFEQIQIRYLARVDKLDASIKKTRELLTVLTADENSELLESDAAAENDGGQNAGRKWQRIPEKVIALLKQHDSLHVNEIKLELEKAGVKTTRSALTGILENYRKKGTFERVKPATYELVEAEPAAKKTKINGSVYSREMHGV